MATKKSASKKAAEGPGAPVKAAAKKVDAKKTPEKKTVAAAAPQTGAGKARPSHHDIEVQAYLLWERDGKKHGHHDQYWQQAERELHS